MSEAEFITTGYHGLQTGILGVTAIFTLVFAYLGGLHLFLRKEPLLTRIAVFTIFVGAYLFVNIFLYSAALFGQEWLDLRIQAVALDPADYGFYEGNSVTIMRITWGIIALGTLAFTTIDTFRSKT